MQLPRLILHIAITAHRAERVKRGKGPDPRILPSETQVEPLLTPARGPRAHIPANAAASRRKQFQPSAGLLVSLECLLPVGLMQNLAVKGVLEMNFSHLCGTGGGAMLSRV